MKPAVSGGWVAARPAAPGGETAYRPAARRVPARQRGRAGQPVSHEPVSHKPVSHAQDNHPYQRDLAAALVAGLGFDDALAVCRSNGWDGVLRVLLAERPVA